MRTLLLLFLLNMNTCPWSTLTSFMLACLHFLLLKIQVLAALAVMSSSSFLHSIVKDAAFCVSESKLIVSADLLKQWITMVLIILSWQIRGINLKHTSVIRPCKVNYLFVVPTHVYFGWPVYTFDTEKVQKRHRFVSCFGFTDLVLCSIFWS